MTGLFSGLKMYSNELDIKNVNYLQQLDIDFEYFCQFKTETGVP